MEIARDYQPNKTTETNQQPNLGSKFSSFYFTSLRVARTKRLPLVAISPLSKTTPRFAVLLRLKKTQGLPITPSHLQMLTAIVHQDMPLLEKSKVLDGFQSKTPESQNGQRFKIIKIKRFLRLAFHSFTFLFMKRHLETDQSTADLHPQRPISEGELGQFVRLSEGIQVSVSFN